MKGEQLRKVLVAGAALAALALTATNKRDDIYRAPKGKIRVIYYARSDPAALKVRDCDDLEVVREYLRSLHGAEVVIEVIVDEHMDPVIVAES